MSSEFIDTEYGKISRELNKAKLEDICVPENGVQTGPFGSLLHKKDYVDSGTPIITVEHLDDNRISHIETPFVSDEDKERLSKYVMHEGDIVFSRVGSVDRRALVRESEDGWLFSGRCLRVRVNQEVIDPVYLSHFFGMENFKAYVRSIAVGATMPSLNTKLLSDLPIYYPEYEKQLEIADILETLDQKIHLNRQTNDTLEAMAQAIFRSWFVDFDPVHTKIEARSAGRDPNRAAMAEIAGVSSFASLFRQGYKDQEVSEDRSFEMDWDEIEAALDQKLSNMTEEQRQHLTRTAQLFPDELVESEIGVVPKGWDYSTIGKEFNIVNGQSPPGSSYNEEREGAPFYQGRTDFGFRFPTQRVYCTEPKRFAKKGDTLLSVRAPVGDLNIAIEDCCIGRGLSALRHKSGSSSYTYYAMKQVQAQIEAYEATGTVFGSINQNQLKALETISPDDNIIDEFHRIAEPIDSKIMNQVFMNRELSELRDTLLPKLISGEVGV